MNDGGGMPFGGGGAQDVLMALYVSTQIGKVQSNPTRRISPSCAPQSHEETLRLSCLEIITCSSCFRILR